MYESLGSHRARKATFVKEDIFAEKFPEFGEHMHPHPGGLEGYQLEELQTKILQDTFLSGTTKTDIESSRIKEENCLQRSILKNDFRYTHLGLEAVVEYSLKTKQNKQNT